MTINDMKEYAKEYGYTNEMIAEQTGVSVGAIGEIFAGPMQFPDYNALIALARFFKTFESGNDYIAETSAYLLQKQQGDFTIEDYNEIADDYRVELIDGVIYRMWSPSPIHQRIIMEISRQIANYINENNGECEVFTAPLDVQLNRDNWTMVQPDIVLICDNNKIGKRILEGAPDLVMEILSPSTKNKDLFIKLNKYKDAGVREYWIIDSEEKIVTVYEFEKNNFSVNYTFDNQIPIGIYGGELRINMTKIKL